MDEFQRLKIALVQKCVPAMTMLENSRKIAYTLNENLGLEDQKVELETLLASLEQSSDALTNSAKVINDLSEELKQAAESITDAQEKAAAGAQYLHFMKQPNGPVDCIDATYGELARLEAERRKIEVSIEIVTTKINFWRVLPPPEQAPLIQRI